MLLAFFGAFSKTKRGFSGLFWLFKRFWLNREVVLIQLDSPIPILFLNSAKKGLKSQIFCFFNIWVQKVVLLALFGTFLGYKTTDNEVSIDI